MTVSLNVAACLLSYYAAMLLFRSYTIWDASGQTPPRTMGEAARRSFQNPIVSQRAASCTYFIVYGLFAFVGNSGYVLVMGSCLQA